MNKNELVNACETALDNWGRTYTPSVIKNLVDEWENQKTRLRTILRNHPSWDENSLLFENSQLQTVGV